MSGSVLDARHQVASAQAAILDAAGQVTRALAWQRKQEVSTVANLETALEQLGRAQRMLHEAIVELRRADREERSS